MNANNKEKYAPDLEKSKTVKGSKSALKVVILVMIGFVIGVSLGDAAYFAYMSYKVAKDRDKWIEDRLQPYREDFVGGSTPEETIDLFIEALKKGDMDLASKYFILDKQEEWRKTFKSLNNQQVMDLVNELNNAKKIWNKELISDDKIEFWYNIKTEEPSRDINLIKNINNNWKIESL